MALTILVHQTEPNVGIVRWFRDPNFSIAYASGPITNMSLGEFRAVGYNFVRQHFDEYQKIRLPEEKVIKVFQPGEAKIAMKDRIAVHIARDPDGKWVFSPREIRRYDLGCLDSLGKETHRIIHESSPPDVFWKTFDEVLAIAGGAV